MKFLLLILSILSVTACGPAGHMIAGATVGFPSTTTSSTVLANYLVDGLQIRLVRISESLCQRGYREIIELNGPINADSSMIIERLLRQILKEGPCRAKSSGQPYVTPVFMNSTGGLLEDGYKIGRAFKRYKVKALVVDGQICASSCAVAFLGADFRAMRGDAVLMFHAPYRKSSFGMAGDCSNHTAKIRLKHYYNEMLGLQTGSVLFKRTMNYCSRTEGWEVNTDAAKMFGITNSFQ